MKVAVYARTIFGAAAVLAGVVALMWHGSEVWQRALAYGGRYGTDVAWCLGVIEVVGGLGLLYPRTARVSSILVGAAYALLALACVPDIVHAPRAYVGYGNFFEQFSVVCGAIALYAASGARAARSRGPRTVARFGFGLCAASFALAQYFYFQFTASLVPHWIPPDPAFWTTATTVAFGLAAVALLVDRQARLAARLLSLMVALFGALVWVPHVAGHPTAFANWSEFAETVLIAGAALAVAEIS
jgi:uncharacterized membrane protein